MPCIQSVESYLLDCQGSHRRSLEPCWKTWKLSFKKRETDPSPSTERCWWGKTFLRRPWLNFKNKPVTWRPGCSTYAQLCPTLCDPMNHSLPGSSVHGILQERILDELPCSPAGDLPNPGMEPSYLLSPALTGELVQETVHLGSP